MNIKRIAKFSLIAFVAVIVLAGTAYTQTSERIFLVQVGNICSQQSVLVNSISLTAGNLSDTAEANFTLQPGSAITGTFLFRITGGGTVSDPSLVEVTGVFNNESFSALFRGIVLGQAQINTSVAGGCLQVLVTEDTGDEDGGTPTPQPTDPVTDKPISGGETMDQTLTALSNAGIQISIDGSESNPKIGNVGDPILLRGIDAFNAQVIWVSAPGLLRTVITWDNPNVDLDLLVFGLGACFQLNPVGYLAELCDRAPFGPVPGNVFAVIIINWSITSQQYTVSLST